MKKIVLGLLVVILLIMIGSFLMPATRAGIKRWVRGMQLNRSFVRPLEALTHERINAGYIGRYCLVLQPTVPTEYIIVSNVQGEIPAFERILSELKRRAWLNDDLKLKEGMFLVLDGNIIGTGPDSLGLLTRLMHLMKANPDRLFYIRGTNEDRENWRYLSLGKEIAQIEPELDQLRRRLRLFFNTLPICLYVFPLGQERFPVRISYEGDENYEMKRSGCYLVSDKGKATVFCSLDHRCSFVEQPLGALITGDERGINWQTMLGLQRVGTPPAWHVVSSARPALKEKQRFSVDSFVVLSVKAPGTGDTMSLYHTLKEKPDLFVHGGTFNVLDGSNALK